MARIRKGPFGMCCAHEARYPTPRPSLWRTLHQQAPPSNLPGHGYVGHQGPGPWSEARTDSEPPARDVFKLWIMYLLVFQAVLGRQERDNLSASVEPFKVWKHKTLTRMCLSTQVYTQINDCLYWNGGAGEYSCILGWTWIGYMTLNFWPFCPHHLSARITGKHHHTYFLWCRELNPWIYTSPLPT